jgi:hypothetical protein
MPIPAGGSGVANARRRLVARAQAAALAGMVDTCTIQRVTGESTGAGGVITPTYSTTYSGACKVQQQTGMSARPDEAGEAALLMVTRSVHLPVSASTDVKADDVITITAIGDGSDPALVGKVFVVKGEAAKTYASARRVSVEEVTS